ncbi:MAG: TIGR00730 family Rossman fold protein [Lachnospiraceae bacterium]|nr:TIGR00730 family Rossman fold protein [Lachnospiraceae bacterium]
MNIAVYLGSSEGNDPIYKNEIKKLGELIGSGGHTLVYGGSSMGLMGAVADAVLSSGGHVIGVEPGFFIETAPQHEGIDELIETTTIAERREKMMELADLFIVFPGGIGTLDEMSEVFTMKTIGRLDKDIILYNLNNFYEFLIKMLDKMTESGFITAENRKKLFIANDINEIEQILLSQRKQV